jgi:alpha-galactosidase
MQKNTVAPMLSIDPSTGILTFQSARDPNCKLQSRINVSGSLNSQPVNLFSNKWEILAQDKPAKRRFSFGTGEQTRLHLATTHPGITVTLWLGSIPDHSTALLQMEIRNDSADTLILEQITLLDAPAGHLSLGSHETTPDLTFYSHGWQSWSNTNAYRQGDKQHTSMLKRLQNPMVVNPGTPQPKDRNHFTGDMFGLLGDLTQKTGLLVGFLSQKQQYGSLEARLNPQATSLKVWANSDNIHLVPGKKVITDLLWVSFVDLDQPDPLGDYLEAVALEHDITSHAPVPVGWCSWYHFYQDIDTKNINANLDSVITLQPDLPLPLFQIDDGFETYPGDWYDFTDGFPHGLRPIVDKAKAAGLIPGVWLAPFIIHPKAKLVQEHPDWLLRDAKGKLVSAGFVWNALTLALDLTNPEALAYTCDVIRTAVDEWGFEYLKLDFLYAAALEGIYQNPTLSRAQVLRMGLEALREAAGPKITMLACGCPFGSALGLFEAMRVSADVNGYWKPHFVPVSAILQGEPHMPSARNAIHNIMTRSPLHKRWWVNDPDCLLVRPDTHLSLAEVQSLASVIGLTGGSILVSDDLPQLPQDRLRLAQVLLPVIGERAQVLDLLEQDMPARLRVDLNGPIGPWHLLALFNWDDHEADLELSMEKFDLSPDAGWWLREFWTGSIGQMQSGAPYRFSAVPSHGARVAAVRRFDSSQPAYLGSDLHLSQGMEVRKWRSKRAELAFTLDLGHAISGTVQLYLPWQPTEASINGASVALQPNDRAGIYTVHMSDAVGKEIKIKA